MKNKLFRIDEIFKLDKGKRLVKADMIEGTLNYIGAISCNNGVRQKIDAKAQFDGNCITVNYNGSVGEAFYQPKPFWASDDVNVLRLKNYELDEYIALYLITIIKANKNKFSYGRKWTLEKMSETEILLPIDKKEKPNYKYMRSYIQSLKANHIRSNNQLTQTSINTSNWNEFKLSDIFDVSVSNDLNLQSCNNGSIPYITASSDNNGVTAYVDLIPSQLPNVLTIARNGSVGSTFYQPFSFCSSPDDVRILTPKFKMNVYIGLFIKTVIEKEKFRYAYGRKLGTKRIQNMVIKLPTTVDGIPDFEYMEKYIKSLPYADRI